MVAIATSTNGDNPANNNGSAITTPQSDSVIVPDMQITKSVDRSTFPNKTGELITWTLNYRNNQPIVLTNVRIIDQLPAELEFVSASRTPVATGTMAYPQP